MIKMAENSAAVGNSTSKAEVLVAKDPAEKGNESLSAKISNLSVVNDSLHAVSKTCKTIRRSKSCVGYGITVAESSLSKAWNAGRSFLDSESLAPITSRAVGNIRYLDKEVGAMVDKLFTNTGMTGDNEASQNGSVSPRAAKEGIQDLSQNTKTSTSLVERKESMVGLFSRKLFEMTTFLIFFPKYAVAAFLNLLQSTPESSRKRKERGSVCEDIKKMEPSPVKRRYDKRLRESSSSSDGGEVIEMLHVKESYVSDEDPDYEPPDNESEELTEEFTEGERTGSDTDEMKEEVKYLKESLENQGISVKKYGSTVTQDSEEKNDQSKLEAVKEPSSAANKKEQKPLGEKTKKGSWKKKLGIKSKEQDTHKGEEVSPVGKTEKPNQETTLSKEHQDKAKDKAEASKEEDGDKDDTSSGKGFDSSSKTRKSSRSPLLEKLLSPGRRKSQRERSKSDKESSDSPAASDKIEEIPLSEKSQNVEHSEKVDKPEIAEEPEKAEKIEKGEKKEKSEKTTGKTDKEKVEKSKKSPELSQNHSSMNAPAMSMVSGAFDVFKMGGKKSK